MIDYLVDLAFVMGLCSAVFMPIALIMWAVETLAVKYGWDKKFEKFLENT